MATVRDVFEHPVLGPRLRLDVEDADHRHDLWEARYRAARGIPMPKALWRRLRRYRRRQEAMARG